MSHSPTGWGARGWGSIFQPGNCQPHLGCPSPTYSAGHLTPPTYQPAVLKASWPTRPSSSAEGASTEAAQPTQHCPARYPSPVPGTAQLDSSGQTRSLRPSLQRPPLFFTRCPYRMLKPWEPWARQKLSPSAVWRPWLIGRCPRRHAVHCRGRDPVAQSNSGADCGYWVKHKALCTAVFPSEPWGSTASSKAAAGLHCQVHHPPKNRSW
jgi:hypothetical protein